MADGWETIAKPSGGWETIGAPTIDAIPGQDGKPVAPPKPKAEPSMIQKVIGGAEADLSMLSGMPAGVIGALAGTLKNVTSGKYGTKEGITLANKTAEDVSGALTYQPRTEAGQDLLKTAGDTLESTKLGGMGPTEAVGVGASARMPITLKKGAKAPEVPVKPAPAPVEPNYSGVLKGAVERAKETAKEQKLDWDSLSVKVKRTMVETAKDATSFEGLSTEAQAAKKRLESLPVPVKSVTKGQLERDPIQLRMEQQLAQTPQGEKINQVHVAQNKELLDNLEVLVEKPGAKSKNAEQVGGKVDFALRAKEDASKADYKALYNKANNSPEGSKPVSVKKVADFLNDSLEPGYNTTAETALQKLKAIKKDAQGNWMPARDLTLRELEKVRVVVGAERANGGAAAGAASKLVNKIDEVFRANEGDKYKVARKAFENHELQFSETGSVAKIVGDKTRVDRQTAFENVYKKTVESGSIQDLRNVRDALLDMETSGTRKQGRKAWRELAGQTVSEIKKAATDNLATDEKRRKNFSPSGMRDQLDKIGDEKLDILLGPGVSKQLRDVLDGAIDIKTSPPKRIQGSDTAINALTVATGILDKALSKAEKIPFLGPMAKGGVVMGKAVYDAGKQEQRIREAVGEPLTLKKAKTLEQRP